MLLPYSIENKIEAGCDEAGRGCLAGPVVAAAVILKNDCIFDELNDSKKLSKLKRDELRYIIETNSIAYSVAFVDNIKIDEINILNASILAMHLALDKLTLKPEHIIVDGNRFKKYKDIPNQCIIKGDAKYISIAAASILAKTYRDEYMEMLDIKFPGYGWHKNMGYPTKEHRAGIKALGTTPFHRITFKLLENQLELEF